MKKSAAKKNAKDLKLPKSRSTDTTFKSSVNNPPTINEMAVQNQKKLTPVLIIAILLLAVISGAFAANNLLGGTSLGKCQNISRVIINPGKVAISKDDLPIELSALSYDPTNTPIWTGVSYEWGISSSNSVGTLKPNNDLVTFTPLNIGTGDLFVKAKNACTKSPVIGSVSISINNKQISVTPTEIQP